MQRTALGRLPRCMLTRSSTRRQVTLARRCVHLAVTEVLEQTDWLLPDPTVQVTRVQQQHSSSHTTTAAAPPPPAPPPAAAAAAVGGGFYVIRDDLLHPFLGGNKFRKLDGLWPSLRHATDIVTCGGMQSAHAVAVAAAAAQHGQRAHLLVRGERPAVPTGHHLYARMFAHQVVYVSRAEYADREAMFARYVQQLQAAETAAAAAAGAALEAAVAPPFSRQHGQAEQQLQHLPTSAVAAAETAAGGSSPTNLQVAIIPEGAATAGALLGLIRLVAWLSQHSPLAGRRCNIVVDSGTGATATGLALGAALLGLPWWVTGVMLAAEDGYYLQQQESLVASYCAEHGGLHPREAAGAAAAPLAAPLDAAATKADAAAALQQAVARRLRWVQRPRPRKFGKVLPGEVAACQEVARQHGLVLDPMWSLAAWEVACELAAASASGSAGGGGVGSNTPGAAAGGENLAEEVVMLHTGGMLGLCGLAQRFPDQF